MTVIVKHNKTNTITDWTQAQLDEQIALGNFAPGTTLANIVLPSDWNNDHTLTGVGTMAEQDATAVAITGGTINNTTIGSTTATTGRFTSVTTPSVTATTTNLNLYPASTGNVIVNQSSGGAFGAVLAQDIGTSTNSSRLFFATSAGTASIWNGGGDNLTFRTAATIGTSSGTEQMRITNTASAVNYAQVTGGATGNSPVISAQGSDAAVALSFTSKSTNAIRFLSNNAANLQFRIVGTNTAVNNLAVTGTIATNAPSLSSEGSDTNISMAFQPKGTGAIDLAAGSSGVNISNGGTVTAITRTAQGSGYTTLTGLTWSASAPTTAGGVTATGTVSTLGGISATLVGGGTGYTAGNVLTVSGGTFSSASTITVNTVSAGVITSATLTNGGTYTVVPSNPVSVTGGSGSGATFNISYGVLGLAIGNAGSGYIEQPTITFSGGGGSGAAAYATVGSGTTVKSLNGTMSFNTPAGESVRISNGGFSTLTDYVELRGGSSVSGAYVTVGGSTANASLYLSSKASSNIQFYTNSFNQEQMRVAHTASAVNYVQVTGGATGVTPIISVQGSDTNAILTLRSKGTFAVTMQSSAGANMFEALPTASSVNYLRVTPSIASSAPILSAQGTDTNIDLALTPKGTGVVQFGTRTASADVAITGYIEIKDAGGTVRRLAVVG